MKLVFLSVFASVVTYTFAHETILSYPALEAHDAAMAYLPYSDSTLCREKKTHGFKQDAPFHTKSGQSTSGFTSLLHCGARSLDLRLQVCQNDHDKLCMHHDGAVITHTTFNDELPSIIKWSNDRPDEIVILKIVPDGDARELVTALLSKNNITMIKDDGKGCWNGGKPMKLVSAKNLKIIAVFNECVDDNYDTTIGFRPGHTTGCVNALQEYADKVVTERRTQDLDSPDAKFGEVQYLWQSTATEMWYLWSLHYNILKINKASGLNGIVAGWLEHKNTTASGLLYKVNNICQNGIDMAKALGTAVSQSDINTCQAMCGMDIANNVCGKV